jgi:hypothetical protein
MRLVATTYKLSVDITVGRLMLFSTGVDEPFKLQPSVLSAKHQQASSQCLLPRRELCCACRTANIINVDAALWWYCGIGHTPSSICIAIGNCHSCGSASTSNTAVTRREQSLVYTSVLPLRRHYC